MHKYQDIIYFKKVKREILISYNISYKYPNAKANLFNPSVKSKDREGHKKNLL